MGRSIFITERMQSSLKESIIHHLHEQWIIKVSPHILYKKPLHVEGSFSVLNFVHILPLSCLLSFGPMMLFISENSLAQKVASISSFSSPMQSSYSILGQYGSARANTELLFYWELFLTLPQTHSLQRPIS